MNVTGVLWLLYPLVGFMAFMEFLVGLAYCFYCLPFFVFFLPLISGVVSLITSVYSLMIQFPNRCELTLQFLSVLFSFCLFLTSLTEAVCLRRIHYGNGSLSVCAGLLNRTLASTASCNEVLGEFQGNILNKLAISDVHSLEISLASILAFCSLVHFCSGVILSLFSAHENRFRLSPPHWQVIFGLCTLLISYAYHSYCCVFFFAYFPTIVACFCLAQAAVPWHFRDKSTPRQLFSIVGAALSTALVAVTSFGFYCWANRFTPPTERAPGVYRYCTVPRNLYTMCSRTLEFSTPYLWWTNEQVVNETGVVQLITYILLTLTGCIHFTFFICDAFG
ncbi:hypothetical protein M3Y99_01218300 [Aphelenchoides fujianensis]|nr:hypothetical protein M3Y99_01218300 [Aphelenchoides fujianensis]